MKRFKIVIIEDDEVFSKTLEEILEDYDVCSFSSSLEGIENIKNCKYDILILDYFIDKLCAADVVRKIREFNKDIYIILLTGFYQEVSGVESLKKLEIQDYCEKDVRSFDTILIRIESAVKSLKYIEEVTTFKKETFGQRLKKLREGKMESQAELAKLLGISRQAICSYETDKSEAPYENLKKLATHYKVVVDYLIGNDY